MNRDKYAIVAALHLALPSYTDKYFSEEQSVFLAEGYEMACAVSGTADFVPGAWYVYSDCLEGPRQEAWEVATAIYDKRTAACHELYLQYLASDASIKLVHVLAGVNKSNGFPYKVYGYVRS